MVPSSLLLSISFTPSQPKQAHIPGIKFRGDLDAKRPNFESHQTIHGKSFQAHLKKLDKLLGSAQRCVSKVIRRSAWYSRVLLGRSNSELLEQFRHVTLSGAVLCSVHNSFDYPLVTSSVPKELLYIFISK